MCGGFLRGSGATFLAPQGIFWLSKADVHLHVWSSQKSNATFLKIPGLDEHDFFFAGRDKASWYPYFVQNWRIL